jgi:transcriptional regulator with XRE-family HTH domain
MKRDTTDYEEFEASSAENRRLLREEEFILEVTERLTDMLDSEKISKVELARRLRKTKGFVTQILSGSRNLTLRTVADVSDALGYAIEMRAVKLITMHHHRKGSLENVCSMENWKELSKWSAQPSIGVPPSNPIAASLLDESKVAM